MVFTVQCNSGSCALIGQFNLSICLANEDILLEMQNLIYHIGPTTNKINEHFIKQLMQETCIKRRDLESTGITTA